MTRDCPRGTILPLYLPIFHKAIFSSMWMLTARGGGLGKGQDCLHMRLSYRENMRFREQCLKWQTEACCGVSPLVFHRGPDGREFYSEELSWADGCPPGFAPYLNTCQLCSQIDPGTLI